MDEREVPRQLVRAVGLEVARRRERARGEAAYRRLVFFPTVAQRLKPVDVAVDVRQKTHADDVSIIAAWAEIILCFDIVR